MCPAIVLVKRVQSSMSRCIIAFSRAREAAPVHRIYSIDEWSFQLRGEDRCPETGRKGSHNASRGKSQVFLGPWMTCSIGIAPTRLLAKMASNLQKPDGLTFLPIGDMPDRMEHLPLKSLYGISNRMLLRLNRHGIWNIRDYGRAKPGGSNFGIDFGSALVGRLSWI